MRILLYRAETWTATKREDSKIQAMEMKFSEKDMINTNVRLELGVDEIKNNIKRANEDSLEM